MTTEARDTSAESVRTVGEVVRAAMPLNILTMRSRTVRELVGEDDDGEPLYASHLTDMHPDPAEAERVCAALGLDPATVLDGPLVILHPGQHVVEYRYAQPGEWAVDDDGIHGEFPRGSHAEVWVTVVSNPQERTP